MFFIFFFHFHCICYLSPNLYNQLKATHKAIYELKMKSGLTWTDEGGMGMDERDPTWIALAKVCEYLSILSFKSNHY
jgi:hypothetical protein